MTYYIVEHGSSDYRLHRDDGTETGDTWSSEPADTVVITAIGVDRGLAKSDAEVFAELLTNGYDFRRSGDTPW